MGNWGISPNASEIEKIKADLNDFINGLKSTCKINYATYSMLFDYINPLIQKAYYLGKDVDTIWEYMILDDAQDGTPDTEFEFNELGKEGWELVMSKTNMVVGNTKWYFKRLVKREN